MLNADDFNIVKSSLNELTDKNLFSYCDNNPVIRADEGGYLWGNIFIGAAVGAAISIGSQLVSGASLSDINWRDVGGAALSGAIASIPGVEAVGTAILGGVGNVIGGYASGSIKSIKDVARNFISGAVANGVGYKVSKITGNFAKKSFNKLTRPIRKTKLAKIYSSKGNMRNINLKISRRDLNFGEKLCPVRSFVYSTISSEFSGITINHGLRVILD